MQEAEVEEKENNKLVDNKFNMGIITDSFY
jgi:hypothetical protein